MALDCTAEKGDPVQLCRTLVSGCRSAVLVSKLVHFQSCSSALPRQQAHHVSRAADTLCASMHARMKTTLQQHGSAWVHFLASNLMALLRTSNACCRCKTHLLLKCMKGPLLAEIKG